MSETPHTPGASWGPPPPYDPGRQPPRRQPQQQPPYQPPPPVRPEPEQRTQHVQPPSPQPEQRTQHVQPPAPQPGPQWDPPADQQHTMQYEGGTAQFDRPYDAYAHDAGHDAGHDEDYDDYAGGSGEIHLASIPRRAGARFVDNLLVSVLGFALIVPITFGIFGLDAPGSRTAEEGAVWNWPILITLFAVMALLPFAAEAVQLALWGRTIGKRMLHLGVAAQSPAGARVTTVQAVLRAAVNNVGYQLGLFLFLWLAVTFWPFFAYGMLVSVAGAVMSYLWAIWDEPFRLAVHDRLAGTMVLDERVWADDDHDHSDHH